MNLIKFYIYNSIHYYLYNINKIQITLYKVYLTNGFEFTSLFISFSSSNSPGSSPFTSSSSFTFSVTGLSKKMKKSLIHC